MGKQPVERVDGHDLDSRDLINPFSREDSEGAFHRSNLTRIAQGVSRADKVSSLVHQQILRAPTIEPNTLDAPSGFYSGDAKAFQNLLPDSLNVPYNVAAFFFRGVRETIDFTQGAGAAIPLPEHHSPARVAQVDGNYVLEITHAGFSLIKCGAGENWPAGKGNPEAVNRQSENKQHAEN